MLLDISEYGYESDIEFCEKLAERVGRGLNHLIRLHFVKKNDTLYDALNRLEQMKEKMRKI